jgi:hypothetical protein
MSLSPHVSSVTVRVEAESMLIPHEGVVKTNSEHVSLC